MLQDLEEVKINLYWRDQEGSRNSCPLSFRRLQIGGSLQEYSGGSWGKPGMGGGEKDLDNTM